MMACLYVSDHCYLLNLRFQVLPVCYVTWYIMSMAAPSLEFDELNNVISELLIAFLLILNVDERSTVHSNFYHILYYMCMLC